MMSTVNLTPDLEGRVVAEAARVGVTPDRLVAGLLNRHHAEDQRAAAVAEAALVGQAEAARVAANRRAAAVALLDSWLTAADPTDQQETLEALVQGIDANRPGQRPHFPPEAKGRTW